VSDPDPGVARKRTALAWQRTALSLITACAIAARLLWTSAGIYAVAPLVAAAVLAGWVLHGTRPRSFGSAAGVRVGMVACAAGMMCMALLVTSVMG